MSFLNTQFVSLCVCVCWRVCVCERVHVTVHVYIHVCLSVFSCVCFLCVCVWYTVCNASCEMICMCWCVCMGVCMYVCVCVCVSVPVCMYASVCMSLITLSSITVIISQSESRERTLWAWSICPVIQSYPLRDDMPALMISSTNNRLLAITVQECSSCFLTL